jgi:hypothetical protein
MRSLGNLQRESAASPFVFTSERGAPFATAGFAKLIERAGAAAGFTIGSLKCAMQRKAPPERGSWMGASTADATAAYIGR